MAYKNKLIVNKITGQDILFLQTSKDTNGEFLEMESTYHSNSEEPPVHYHPYQSEDFKVIEGELTVKMYNRERTFKKGESFSVKPGEPHSMWNSSGNKTIVNWKVSPAMNTELLFETFNGLIKDGKTNSKGVPGILQLSLTVNKFSPVFRLVKPPFFIQKILFSLITPFAWLAGYRAIYKEYID